MPTTTPFNNLITFSRGSNATVTGSNGLIQWAPNNLLTFSEQFDNAAWTKNTATVAPNNAVAPDGTTTADTVTFTATGYASVFVTVTVAAGLPYTTSVYAKAGTTSVFSMEFRGSSAIPDVVFNLADGTVTSGTGTITPVGNGWYRCSITKTSVDTSELIILGSGFVSALGSVLLWGAQLELGSTATTYNPTTVKNLLGFSEAFDNAAFTKLRASIVTGAQANPVNGLFNAQKLMEDTTASNTHLISQGPTLTAAPHVLSVYVKAAGRNWFALVNNSIANVSAYFDLANGVVGTVGSAATASITNVGSGWYRCSMAFTAIAATNNLHFRLASANGVDSYTGDGNSGVYIYGAQLSDSASLDPYVPTPGAAPSSTAFYGPRFDFDPVTRAPRGLLVEEQRTNLALRSDDFANATWVKSDVNVTANSAVAPDGDTTADLLIPTAVNTVHTVVQTITTPASSTAFSFYAKPGGYNFIQVHDGTSATDYINFDLSTGVVGNASGYTGAITAVGNGWYRCTAFKTFTAAAHEFRLNPLDANTASRRPSFAGNGTSGVLVWGVQLEAGAFATSYIPTIASTVTRSADVATITGQNFAQWYRQDEGTIAWIGDFVAPANAGLCGSDDGSSNNAIILRGETSNLRSFVRVGGAATSSLVASGMVQASSKVAFGYASANFGAYVNASGVTGASGAVPLVTTRFTIGLEATNNYLNGHIRNIRFIPARAADFQLQALTT